MCTIPHANIDFEFVIVYPAADLQLFHVVPLLGIV